MKNISLIVCTIFFLLPLTHSASADPIVGGTPGGGININADQVSSHNTTGYDMNGILITVSFANGPSETKTWSGGASGTGWSLMMDDMKVSTFDDNLFSTYGNSGASSGFAWWNFTYSGSDTVKSVTIDGNIVNSDGIAFDIVNWSGPPAPIPTKTANSANGYGFELQSQHTTVESNDPNLSITYQYNNALGFNSAPPVNDLWEVLTISFGGTTAAGLTNGSQLVFRADTDEIMQDPVPEPATLILFCTGLFGLAGARRMRKK